MSETVTGEIESIQHKKTRKGDPFLKLRINRRTINVFDDTLIEEVQQLGAGKVGVGARVTAHCQESKYTHNKTGEEVTSLILKDIQTTNETTSSGTTGSFTPEGPTVTETDKLDEINEKLDKLLELSEPHETLEGE